MGHVIGISRILHACAGMHAVYYVTPMKYSCDALLLLAETEVAMTTIVISSHVKDKNCIFTGYQIFVTGKILVFRQCLYNKYYLTSLIRMDDNM